MRKTAVLFISLCLVVTWSGISYAGTKALMEQLCTRCHNLKRPLSKKKDKAGWATTVDRMSGRSSQITDEYKKQIVDFLSKVRGKDMKITRSKDPASLNQMEKLHIPLVNAPIAVAERAKAKISVQIGEEPHPMTKDHYIYAVDLYVNNAWEDMAELEPGQEPKVEFEPRIYKTFPIEIISHCTVDGHWSATTEIKAE